MCVHRTLLGIILLGASGSFAGSDVTSTATARSIAELLPGPSFDWGTDVSGPMCGVYAACTAAEIVGIKADPRDFIATRYVGQCGGSSPEEVARVVTDAGAKASILTQLSAVDLRLMDCPLIANVRISPTSNRFNHWVVAVPSDAGVTIYDGLQTPYDISTAAFLGSWSGIGICVTRPESSPLASIWLGRCSLLLSVGIVGVAALRNRRVTAPSGTPRPLKQFGALCIASVALCIAGNAVFGDLVHHGEGVAVATASSQGGKYRVGRLEDAKRASSSRDELLVDARREVDFRLGTIDGAVNVPVTASIWAINRYLEKLDRETPIVVFCQSARCEYDETVAAQAVSLGFTDVTVCDQGWVEFQQAATKK